MTKDLFAGKKVAIVDDWLTNRGGTARVIETMIKAFPEAVIYTSLYIPEALPEFKGRVRTSFLQKMLPPFIRKKHQYFLHLMPWAFASLDLSEFDIVISSSSAFSKNIKTRPDQLHVCYCHTPVRYLYFERERYLKEYKLPWWMKPAKPFLPMVLDFLTKKDQESIKGVDAFVANSNYVGDRIKKYYKRDSETIYPPIDTVRFKKGIDMKKKEYYFAQGRMVPYKRFDLLVETFIKNGKELKLAGKGPEMERCKQMAFEAGAKNIEFLGYVPEKAVPVLFAKAKAFLFPADEDFGITPVEALASGTPVIYYNKGGATESVAEFGISFEEQTQKSLQDAIDRFEAGENKQTRPALQKRASEFGEDVFEKHLKKYIEKQFKKLNK